MDEALALFFALRLWIHCGLTAVPFPSLDASDGLMLSMSADSLTATARSLRTTLCVRFKSETVACGIIFMAARRCKVCTHSLLIPAGRVNKPLPDHATLSHDQVLHGRALLCSQWRHELNAAMRSY